MLTQITKTLRTKALTESPRGAGEHDVSLQFSTAMPGREGWVLCIDGTSGRWYLSTLMKGDGLKRTHLAIDFGERWYCTNMGELLAEAVTLA